MLNWFKRLLFKENYTDRRRCDAGEPPETLSLRETMDMPPFHPPAPDPCGTAPRK